MFSLIITVISIALVAALAVSTLYFGGDAFNAGSDKAKASTVVNQAQQIDGANTIFRLDTGAFAASVDALVPEYLASAPVVDDTIASGGSYSISDDTVSLSGVNSEVCERINEQVGVDDSSTLTSETDIADADLQYGCDTNGDFYFNPTGS